MDKQTIEKERIIVITYYDKVARKTMVSHGVNSKTLQTIVLPQVPVTELGATKFDSQLGEFYIDE